jgi:hypothetical protein
MANRQFALGLALLLAVGTWLAPAQALAAGDPVLVGAGDIGVCGTSADTSTGNQIEALLAGPLDVTPFTLGDNAYPDGMASQFANCYGPAWGSFKAVTKPSAGNHEYKSADAAPYFAYFGAAAGSKGKGWYSYDRGTWHIVVLNSNCGEVGGCGSTSPQVTWLKADLAAHAGDHVLAYWHHPRYTSGEHGNSPSVQAFWDVLYRAGADVVLNGHDHDYERFAPQDPWGRADNTHGIRQFVVGTGGGTLRAKVATMPNSQLYRATHGVQQLTLGDGSYSWKFDAVGSSSLDDTGTGVTHGPPPSWATKTFMATSDAYVDQAHPSKNYGKTAKLFVDGDTGSGLDRWSYVRIPISGVSGTIDRVALRLWVTNPTGNGPTVSATTTSWSGRTITWANRPSAVGSPAVDAGRITAPGFYDFDVTSLVDGDDGTYAFVVKPTSGDGLDASSMQGAHPPRLIIQTVP